MIQINISYYNLTRSSTPYSYNGIKVMFDPTIEVSERNVTLNKMSRIRLELNSHLF